MASECQDFETFQGDDEVVSITVLDSAGAVVDITGATVSWSMAVSVNTAALIAKTTTGGGITLSDPTNGVFQVAIDEADTISINPGRYYHEAQVEDASSKKSTVTIGHVRIKDALIV